MKTSDKGLIAIARHEGIVPAPYLDVANVWTFGIGHAETAGTPPRPSQMPRGMPSDLDAAIRQSFNLFRAKIGTYEAGVSQAVPPGLAQHEFDALVSLCFNIGIAGFERSSVVRHLKAGNKERAAEAILAWNKARVDGQLRAVAGLTNRRQEEKRMFEAADYGRLSVPVWGVTDRHKPDMSRAIRIISEAEAMGYLAGPAQRPPEAREPQPAPVAQKTQGGFLAAILALLARIFGGKRND